jgi:hypothetical protein
MYDGFIEYIKTFFKDYQVNSSIREDCSRRHSEIKNEIDYINGLTLEENELDYY